MTGLIGPRGAALCGIAFALLLFLGVASLEVPKNVTDEEMTNWWSKDGNQSAALVSTVLVALSAIAFGLFITFLRDRLNGHRSDSGNATYTIGLGFVVLLLASAAARGVIARALMNDEPMPGPDTLRYFPQLQYSLMEVGIMCAGACFLLAAWASKVSGAFPAYLAWTGLVAGVLTLVGVVLVGPFVIPVVLIWAVVASVAAWRSGEDQHAHATQAFATTL